uniref:Titin n=1 Tax=Periophthalmus magnuspinnatus TaxID=409849 RepID=A0A3B4ACM2_9GOBI
MGAAEPEFELDVELRRTLVVRAGCSIRMFVPIKGRPSPSVTWTKEGGAVTRAVIDSTESFTMLLIPESTRNDAGKYELTLENASGKKTAEVHVRVLDSPGPPINLKPVKIDKESITLSWEMPLIDGGAKITNYIIEKRESTRKAFATCVMHCPTTSARIGELGEGCEYYFRVSAENEYGIGEAVETSDPIRASQAPTPPPSIVPTDITKNSVSLAWTRPKHDGGSRITGYVLEAQKKGTDQWAHVTTVKTMDFIVKNLNENEEYIFRVMAVNLSGRSAPRESKPITVKESTMLPEFDLRAVCQKTVIAKAGDDIKVEIPVIGRPRPTVSWQKDGTALKLTQRTNAEMTGATVVLSIGECNRSDSGVYTMTGKNIAGTVSENLIVRVHDVPGPPKGPVKIVEISRTYCVFSWEPPENDGGVPINNYVVEIRDTTSQTWTELSATVIRTVFKAVRLNTGSEYQFRVKAKNRYGAGPPITSEAVVAAYPFKVPGPPGTPHVVAFTKDSITVGWNEPVSDGGSEVLGYHVERKERSSIIWTKISSSMVKGNIFKSSGLEDGMAYEFRVSAENLAGIGKASKASEAILALDPVDPPGQPEPVFVNKNVITIQWTKPEYDGGFKITGYTVEKKELPDGRWIRANFTNIMETQFTVSGLTQDASYEFRVFARNAAGSVSMPSDPSDPITCRDDIVEPRIMVDAVFRDVISHYIVERRETSRLVWTVIDPKVESTCLKVTKLLEGDEYIFRIRAVNQFGVGAPLESAPVLIKDPYLPPEARLAWTVVCSSCTAPCYKV